MTDRRTLFGLGFGLVAALPFAGSVFAAAPGKPAQRYTVSFTPAQWRARLSPDAFAVLREESTERPFTSPLNDEHRRGVFACRGCALPLFSSAHKFDSGTGWPSFWQPITPAAIGRTTDTSFMMERIEVHCSRCGGHQGHVFDDGPKPTGLRYCINGLALQFIPGKVA